MNWTREIDKREAVKFGTLEEEKNNTVEDNVDGLGGIDVVWLN